MAKHPERVIEHAVKGMLPKNTLGRAMGMKLKVYAGAEHPHMAQKPTEIEDGGLNHGEMKHCTTAPVVVRTLSLACASFPALAR